MQDHEVLADGFDRAMFYSGNSTEAVRVTDYPESTPLTNAGREEAMTKMRSFIDSIQYDMGSESVVLG